MFTDALPFAAVIVATPGPTAVIKPDAFIVTTLVCVLDHDTDALIGAPFALNVLVFH